MRVSCYSRKLKKYIQFLVVLISVFVFGHFTGRNNSFLAMMTYNEHYRELRAMDPDAPADIQHHQRTISTLLNASSKNINKTQKTTNAFSERFPLTNGPHANLQNHIIYSENEMMVELKKIHDYGAKMIQLKQDNCKKRLPQVLIIGNYKSGTQEFLEFLFMHPRIRILREPYFETNFFAGQYFKGMEWYKNEMPCSYENQITIEKSACYLQEPDTPARIRAMNSSIKLMALFREPIARALSHFSYSYQFNFDLCAINSTSGAINRDCNVIKHSIYDEGMELYLQYFNRNQIKLIDGDDFKADPYAVLHDVETFLGIEHIIDKKFFVFIKEKGFHCVRSIQNSFRVSCYGRNRGRKSEDKKSKIHVSNSAIKKLQEYFKPRNDRLFELTGQTFNWHYDGF